MKFLEEKAFVSASIYHRYSVPRAGKRKRYYSPRTL